VAVAVQVAPVPVHLIHPYDVGLSVHAAVRVTGAFGIGCSVEAVSVQTGTPAAGSAGAWPDAQKTIGF
jgi:hypothetical protein